MSKPGVGTTSGISSEDVLIPTERHPACRRREARPGSCTERENLTGGAKGKGTSGSNREAESTDAPERGGLPRSSDEGPVMGPERRGQVIAVDLGQPVRREEPSFNGRRQPSRGGTSRMMREYQVRICERLEVKFLGPTRQKQSKWRPASTRRSGSSPATWWRWRYRASAPCRTPWRTSRAEFPFEVRRWCVRWAPCPGIFL